MAIIHTKIPHNYRAILFALLTLSWVTGLLFFALNRWFILDGDFGPEKHSWQYPTLQIHGLAAFGMLMAYGALVTNHVTSAWKTHRLRWIGVTLLGLLTAQIVSAYLLYYLGNEQVRTIVSNLHTINGLLLPLALLVHIYRGIRSRHKMAKVV